MICGKRKQQLNANASHYAKFYRRVCQFMTDTMGPSIPPPSGVSLPPTINPRTRKLEAPPLINTTYRIVAGIAGGWTR